VGHHGILRDRSALGESFRAVLFVQAAWVGLVKPKSWERYGLRSWIEAAKRRLHHNELAIALANKLARIAWAVLGSWSGKESCCLAAIGQQTRQGGSHRTVRERFVGRSCRHPL
jgi:hypothetical protein